MTFFEKKVKKKSARSAFHQLKIPLPAIIIIIIIFVHHYFYLPRIASSVHSCTVINEGAANEVLIVFKAPICSTQQQTLSNIMLNLGLLN